MARLLYVQASPRVARSHSMAVADAFVQSYAETHGEDKVVTRNVFEMPLMPFDGLAVEAKYRIIHGERPAQGEKVVWDDVETLVAEFTAADKYVFAVPMWNFGIPYRLKQYFDVIVQPGYTFTVTPDGGYKGLVAGRPAFIAYARGGEYPAGTAAVAVDHQTTYMEIILGFMGFTDVRSIVVEPTLMGGPETAASRRGAAVRKATEMAKDF